MVPTKVLIVEDSPVQAQKLRLTLEEEGWRVLWAADGQEGLNAARREKPDVIVLDIQLPTLNGFQVARGLKADPTTADIPIIMLTTRDNAMDALTGLEAGAIDYVPKDAFAEAVVLETIRQLREEAGDADD
jgi:twitching motility two-component system response regulator PilH